MPKAIDSPEVRQQVRAIYYANGRNLRAAAKACGIPEDRVEKWKERQKWDDLLPKKDRSKRLSEVSDSVAANLANERERTISALSRASVRHAEHLAKQKPSLDVKRSVVARNWTSVADTVHGFSRQDQSSAHSLDVRVLAGRGRTVIAIDSSEQTSPESPDNLPKLRSQAD